MSLADTLRQDVQAALSGRYAIEREVGGGGMSRVFVAEETRFRRRVVIKVLAPELAAGLSPCVWKFDDVSGRIPKPG